MVGSIPGQTRPTRIKQPGTVNRADIQKGAKVPEQQPLDVLMMYTTFHIGVYVSLTTIFIGASVFGRLNDGVLRWAVFCFLVAGACGGIIAASAAEFTGPACDFFLKPSLRLWCFGPWPFKPFATVEHIAFWAGLLPISVVYLARGGDALTPA